MSAPLSAFSPELPPMLRRPHDELLSEFVPVALRRLPPVARFVHPLRLVVIGFITAGITPCRMLQSRLNRVRRMYAYHAELASENLMLHAASADAALLKESAERVGGSSIFWWLSKLSLLAAIAVASVYLAIHHASHIAIGRLWLHPLAHADRLPQAFAGLTAAAYLLLVLQMNQQIKAMQQLAIAVNGVFDLKPPIAAPPLVFVGRSPLTLLLGAALAGFGLVWALPMAIAWSAYKEFVKVSAYRFRVDLSDRLQAISGRPATLLDAGEFCSDPHCRYAIPDGAAFCPRCGRPVTAGAGA